MKALRPIPQMVADLRTMANDPKALVSHAMLLDDAASYIDGAAENLRQHFAQVEALRAENEQLKAFRKWPLAAPEFGDMRERRRDAKAGEVFAVLVWAEKEGEGEAYLAPNIRTLHPVSAMDALSDWRGLLEHEYGQWNVIQGRTKGAKA